MKVAMVISGVGGNSLAVVVMPAVLVAVPRRETKDAPKLNSIAASATTTSKSETSRARTILRADG